MKVSYNSEKGLHSSLAFVFCFGAILGCVLQGKMICPNKIERAS